MKRRINISIDDDVSVETALLRVLTVVGGGRISGGGKIFCYHSSFRDGIQVSANSRSDVSDSFWVYREQKTEEGK